MNYKNILLVSSEFPPLPGGIGNHAFNLAKHLQRNGFNISVTSDYRLTPATEEDSFDQQNDFSTFRFKRYKFIWKTYLRRVALIRRLSLANDLVIATGKFSLWVVAFFVSKKKRKIAIIHGSEVNFSNPLLRKITDMSLKKFSQIIAVSNNTKNIVSYLGLNNIEVIPNGFDSEKFDLITSI
jgi:glycosyltransferase involved in cell wall biosynthesis